MANNFGVITQRKILLRERGKNNEFINNLLHDAQTWSDLRACLQLHVRKAKDLTQSFRENQYLCDEVSLGGRDVDKTLGKQGKSTSEIAAENLLTIIQRMETDVENDIKRLDEKTQDMIELVSIPAGR